MLIDRIAESHNRIRDMLKAVCPSPHPLPPPKKKKQQQKQKKQQHQNTLFCRVYKN